MWIVNVNTSLPFPCQPNVIFCLSRLRLVKKNVLVSFRTPLKYVKSIQLLFTSVCMFSIFSMMESRDFFLWKRSAGHRASEHQNVIHSAPRKRFISEVQTCSGGRWPPPPIPLLKRIDMMFVIEEVAMQYVRSNQALFTLETDLQAGKNIQSSTVSILFTCMHKTFNYKIQIF